LALRLAQEFHGEIVNGDSLQLYRGMDIGTAKPTPAERASVPHHLYGILPPDRVFTAGEYAATARPLLRDIAARGRLPIICGGAGFYLRALIDGLADAPQRDEALRARLADRRPGALHRYLRRLDAPAAARIHPNDINKLIRAIEVCHLTLGTQTAVHAQRRDALEGFRILKLGLDPPREQLYERINARASAMFLGTPNIVDEVRGLLQDGFTPAAKAFESVGYQQTLAYLAGGMTLAEAIADTQQKTRNYAKRQLTWFRRDANIVWLSGFGTNETVRCSAFATVASVLAQR